MTLATSAREPIRVLLVEDDDTVSEVVVRYLVRAGYVVERVSDGETALEHLAGRHPDVMILDVMLPQMSGFEVCRRIKTSGLPVIMLTARGEENDRVLGLELGADDYIVKPFSPRELVARIRSVLRRSGRVANEGASRGPIEVSGLRLEPQTRRVIRDGEPVAVTATEYALLYFLMSNPGRAYSREELLEQVWGYTFGGTPTVTVHVQRLRKKIEANPERPTRIVTVWGIGYRFET